ncbi:MAG TPA: hypothetical protein VNN07_18110 [Candidatus Tectomicrobia bacterium]|nr:hypothetical protein [Candidatus Tectomicrobia bacterium]
MAPGDLFTREEALGGLPARRAASLLFLLESRTAFLADRSRRAGDFLASEEMERERDLAFLEALSGGREPPVRPTIRDLERHAEDWAPLVPPNAALRAATAHLLGRKYQFTREAVPGIRTALGLDDEAVRRAYRRQHGVDLDTIYAAQPRLLDAVAWAWAGLASRVDRLSPFWLAFGLTIAFSFSQAFLALPTGVARVGAVPGVGLVIAVGLVNVLTMACMAEACARSGDFRYGRAFVGRLVVGYLGAEASALFSAVTAARTFLVMLAGTIGLGLTLAAFTGIPAEAWMVGLVLVELYYLSRKSASVTVTMMLALISVNLLTWVLIALLAFGRLEPAHLLRMRVPFLAGTPVDPSLLELVFGVVAMLYIGHVYVIQCAKLVLPRDPGAASLVRGSVAGTAVLTVIFVVWILAVNGAVDAETLAGEAGTALAPLAARVGPAIHVLGSVLVVLLLGMSCLRTSTVLFNLVQERLPTRLRTVVSLSRRDGALLFEPRGGRDGPRLGLTYLGLAEGRGRLRADVSWDGQVERVDVVLPGAWDAAALLERIAGRRASGVTLLVEPLEADADAVSLRVVTTLSVSFRGPWNGAGVRLSDLVDPEQPERSIVGWITRRGEVGLDEVVAHAGTDAEGAHAMLDDLVARGTLEVVGSGPDRRYRVHLAPRQPRRIPPEIWRALDVPAPPPRGPGRHSRGLALVGGDLLMRDGVRFLVAASPVLLVFALAEWLLLTGAASFAGVLGFGGVVANSLTAGIFPVLLLVASRRKGDYVPAVVYRLLGHPGFTIGVCALAVANIVIHALFIYRNPWSRGATLGVGLATLAVGAVMLRRRVFSRRCVIELREEEAHGRLAITSAGQPLTASVRLGRTEGEEVLDTAGIAVPVLAKLRYAVVALPPNGARELKVWAHRVTADARSEPLAALVEIRSGAGSRRFDLALSGGQVTVPVEDDACEVRLTFPVAAGEAGATGGDGTV